MCVARKIFYYTTNCNIETVIEYERFSKSVFIAKNFLAVVSVNKAWYGLRMLHKRYPQPLLRQTHLKIQDRSSLHDPG